MDRRTFIKNTAAGAAILATPELLKGCVKAGMEPMNKTRGGYFEAFGIDEALVRKVLAAAACRGGDFADVFFQHRISSGLGLEDGKVNRAYSSVDLGAGVRVVKGDQTGYAFTEDLGLEALLEAARTASAIAEGGGPGSEKEFGVAPIGSYYAQKIRWEDTTASEIKPLMQRMNERAAGADGRIKKVRVSFDDEVGRILIASSDGRWAEDCQPMGTVAISCLAEQNGRREENYTHKAARAGLEEFGPDSLDKLASDAVARTLLLFDAIRPPPGEMPVVLSAGSSGILLHEAIGHGMEADFNRKNISIFADRLGKRIAEPFVSIVDDGTVYGARGSINVDDEGTPGQRTVLVENGILRSYMHDRISAAYYKTAPTGNGRRESFRARPIPRMRCTYMMNGPHKKDEIIASVKKGIYAVNFTNGQVQIGAGDFTFYIKTGYLIEDGRLTAPIKDTNIIGNGPKVLENIMMAADDSRLDTGRWTCGKDGQSVPVSLGLPTVKVSAITVGGVK
jgi:TldD protein